VGDMNADVTDCKSLFANHLKQFCSTNELILSSKVGDIVKKLKNNKAYGVDKISTEHLKFASRNIFPLLAICFTGFLIHGILPNSMLYVILVPIVKDRAGKINGKDNYQPIALASTLSKVLEKINQL
uniref:Reverse transcriptase domain-containing protein n=1 Tax=Poecilia reticulata TaxID=8081 RepID=A0A3P9ND53_POERE